MVTLKTFQEFDDLEFLSPESFLCKMTGDGDETRVYRSESVAADDASRTSQRRKKKWDQPAEQLVANIPTVTPLPLFQTTAFSNFNQPKIQDELTIAREIVINDADASLRHKLTKRSTQEEIQRSTGAVVITRGKYRPPNAPPDGNKPLYLHISAATHLKETTHRILAVDRAAVMIEEMMKQKPNSQVGSIGLQTVEMLSACVYLGFEANPSSNVAARIRGPNDQYINHIMNETGATVILKGCGSGTLENQPGEEAHLPLHLLLSSSSPKSIDDAKRLAENLMDTISVEFGASRVSSSKVYGAVPPPQQLLSGAPGEQKPNFNSKNGVMTSIPITAPQTAVSTFSIPPASSLYPRFPVMQPLGILNSGHLQPSLVASGTSYSGYAGIYPQATPLQQVAQVLKQSVSPVSPTVLTSSHPIDISSKEIERRPLKKRKFQELPADCKVPAKAKQELELGEVASGNIVKPSANRVLMPPPPPPPSKTMSPRSSSRSMLPPNLLDDYVTLKKPNPVPETLVKLMEYGDDEEDDDGDPQVVDDLAKIC